MVKSIISQIVRQGDPPRYVYTENGSKNRSGGFKQMRVANKVVPVFPCPGAGVRCHFAVLETYISKLPPVAFQKDWFYMKPLRHDVPSKPWYAAQPCGENKLAGMVKSMFAMIGVSGKTNHSLRATGASMMFQAGVPEKMPYVRMSALQLRSTWRCREFYQHRKIRNMQPATVHSLLSRATQLVVFVSLALPQIVSSMSIWLDNPQNWIIAYSLLKIHFLIAMV